MKIEEYLRNYLNSKSDLAHAKFVENKSLELYTKLKKIFPKNHLLNFEKAEKLISSAALLHDIGALLSTPLLKSHNKVGAELILENKIDDFNDTETIITALCVRYHRGSKPKEHKHKIFASLNQKNKNTIRVISSILRIADSLDYNHLQNIQNIILMYDFDKCTLTLDPGINIIFNKGIKRVFDKKKTLFEEVFKLKIYLKNDNFH